MVKIVTLYQLECKFCERHSFSIASKTLLNRVLRHHVIYSNAFSNVTRKIDKRKVFHPIVVIYHNRSSRSGLVEIQKSRQNTFDSGHVLSQLLFVKQITLVRFPRRITNHSRSTANQSNRLVPKSLQMHQ